MPQGQFSDKLNTNNDIQIFRFSTFHVNILKLLNSFLATALSMKI